jgi:ribosomal protein S18 acetylase RimI-like enzyme
MRGRRDGATVARDYAAEEDLRLVQRLASECWRLEGPDVYVTIGDPAWRMYQHLDKLAEVQVRLWLDNDGEPVAWGWLRRPSTLELLTHPRDRERLVDSVLDWFEETAAAEDTLSVTALESDLVTVAVLERRGYRVTEENVMSHMVRPLDRVIPEPTVPAGYVVRTVRGEQEAAVRTEVHRAAFAPSRVVPESYRRTMREWPYRADLDFVVEAPDGSLVSFCLCWLDAENRIGEFEPVGTHPDHRRRGLARAVCRAGLRGLHAAGAETAVVYSVAGSQAESLYSGLGFDTISRHLEYRR